MLINSKDKIYIAGHNGMAGKAIHNALLKKGYSNFLKVNRKELDLKDFKAVSDFIDANKPDVVVLAAATVGGIQANNKYPVNFLLDNLKIQTNLIENAWKFGTRRLLFLGSSCIYPKNCNQPIKESYLLQSPLEKTNEWYAIAKIAGIKLCEALRKQYDFDAIAVMPTNLYGPGDNFNFSNSHVLPALIRKFYEAKIFNKDEVVCWGSGRPKREFMFIEDFGDACVFILENFSPDINKKESIYLNVGTGQDLTILEIAEKIAILSDFKGKISWDKSKPDGTLQKKLNINLLENLGWKSKFSLEEGLRRTIKYFEKNYKSKSIRL